MDEIELRELRYFIAVAEELNFTRAAARLGMTQPPLSAAIGKLERKLGVTLLERTSRRVTLTPAGAGWGCRCSSAPPAGSPGPRPAPCCSGRGGLGWRESVPRSNAPAGGEPR